MRLSSSMTYFTRSYKNFLCHDEGSNLAASAQQPLTHLTMYDHKYQKCFLTKFEVHQVRLLGRGGKSV